MLTGLFIFVILNGFIGWFASFAWSSTDEFQIIIAVLIIAIAVMLNIMIVSTGKLRGPKDFLITYKNAFFPS